MLARPPQPLSSQARQRASWTGAQAGWPRRLAAGVPLPGARACFRVRVDDMAPSRANPSCFDLVVWAWVGAQSKTVAPVNFTKAFWKSNLRVLRWWKQEPMGGTGSKKQGGEVAVHGEPHTGRHSRRRAGWARPLRKDEP